MQKPLGIKGFPRVLAGMGNRIGVALRRDKLERQSKSNLVEASMARPTVKLKTSVSCFSGNTKTGLYSPAGFVGPGLVWACSSHNKESKRGFTGIWIWLGGVSTRNFKDDLLLCILQLC